MDNNRHFKKRARSASSENRCERFSSGAGAARHSQLTSLGPGFCPSARRQQPSSLALMDPPPSWSKVENTCGKGGWTREERLGRKVGQEGHVAKVLYLFAREMLGHGCKRQMLMRVAEARGAAVNERSGSSTPVERWPRFQGLSGNQVTRLAPPCGARAARGACNVLESRE